jgi:hypothetical protein
LCSPRTRERLAFPLVVTMGLPLVVFALRPSIPIAVAMLTVTGSGFGYQNGIARRFVDVLPADLQGQALRSAQLRTGWPAWARDQPSPARWPLSSAPARRWRPLARPARSPDSACMAP